MPELDGLRGIAVLMVLAWHLVGEIIDPSLGAWAQWLRNVTIVGRTGVDLFFVLSGLLITGIILDRRASPGRFLGVFYLRRALRILPPYLALMLAFLGFRHFTIGYPTPWDMPLSYYFSFLQTWWMAQHGSWGAPEVSVTWSVSIEEHYYLFFPLIALAVPRRWLPPLLAIVASGSAAFRWWIYFGIGENDFYAYVFPLSRLEGLALGGIIACVFRNTECLAWIQNHGPLLRRSAVLFVVVGLSAVAVGLHRDVRFHMYSWGHSLLALLYTWVITAVLGATGRPMVRWLRVRSLAAVASISYSLYLFHPLVLIVVFWLFERRPHLGGWTDAGIVTLALGFTFVLCSFLLQPWEARFIGHGRRYAY